jgi:hypothetical protein
MSKSEMKRRKIQMEKICGNCRFWKISNLLINDWGKCNCEKDDTPFVIVSCEKYADFNDGIAFHINYCCIFWEKKR